MFNLVSHGYNVPETEMWDMPIHILLEREKQYFEKDKADFERQMKMFTCPLMAKKK